MAGQRTPGPTGIDTRATARIDPGTRALTATPPPGGVGGTPESGLGGPVYTLDRHDLGWLDTREAAGALWDALSQSRRHVAAIVRQETGVILDEIIDGILPALAMAVGVLAASAVLGAAVGAALGALAGGVGAAPGAVAGGQAGFAVGMAAMEWLGLGFLAVAVVGALGRVGDYAGRATRRAVNSLFVPTTQQPGEILLAAQDYARAQAELLKAVLVGLVALLLKNSAIGATQRAGTGVADIVAQLRASRLGEGFAAWVEANASRLVANPRLRPVIPESAPPPRISEAQTPSQLVRRGLADEPTTPAATTPPTSPPAPLSAAQRDRIIATPKGSRPDPKTYLPPDYVEAHLARFDQGATRFMTRGNLDKYGIGQRDGTSFVMTRAEADAMLKATRGNKRAMEEALGLPENFLETNELVRIDIPSPRAMNLRIPSGNEAGANDLWIPGGRLPTGSLEAVIDAGELSPGSYSTTPLKF